VLDQAGLGLIDLHGSSKMCVPQMHWQECTPICNTIPSAPHGSFIGEKLAPSRSNERTMKKAWGSEVKNEICSDLQRIKRIQQSIGMNK